MPTLPTNYLRSKPPIANEMVDAQRHVTAPWAAFLNGLGNVAQGPVLTGTHAQRLNTPSQQPYWGAGAYLGCLYYETDRTVLYLAEVVSGVPAWIYVAGQQVGIVASKPGDLGANDAGYLYLGSDDGSLNEWNGAGWATYGGSGTGLGSWVVVTINHATGHIGIDLSNGNLSTFEVDLLNTDPAQIYLDDPIHATVNMQFDVCIKQDSLTGAHQINFGGAYIGVDFQTQQIDVAASTVCCMRFKVTPQLFGSDPIVRLMEVPFVTYS